MSPEEIKEIDDYFKEFEKCSIGYDVAVRIVNKVPALLAALKEKEERISELLHTIEACRIFMTEAWDGKQRSWKFRPGWDEAYSAILKALSADEKSE